MEPWYLHRATGDNRRRRRDVVAEVERQADIAARQAAVEQLSKDGDLQPVTDHPMLRLLNDGNGWLTGHDSRRLTSLYLDLTGEVPWLLDRHARFDTPSQAFPVPPSWCRHRPTPSEPYYLFGHGAWQVKLAPRDVVWFCMPDPSQPYGRSSGIAQALADELEADELAAQFIARHFYNSGRPDVVVTGDFQGDGGARGGRAAVRPKDAGGGSSMPADLQRLERKWLQKARRKLPFFARGEIKLHQLGHNFEQVQMSTLRKYLRDMVVNTAGVPPELIGILSNANRSTIDLANYIHARHNALPRLVRMRETLRAHVLPQYPGADGTAVLTFSNPVREDLEFKLKAMRAQPSAPTQAEWRSVQGLPFRPGTEVHMVKGRAWKSLDDVELQGLPPASDKAPRQDLPLRDLPQAA
ncbi:MAG: phage portal protein [Acidobacteriota bacterium]